MRPLQDGVRWRRASGVSGAARVVGTDIDPQAIEASEANARRNRVTATFMSPDRLPADASAQFDVVVANILANPLRMLSPVLAARVAHRGRVLLSGVLEEQADSLIAAYRRWFNIGVCESEDGWITLAGTRRSRARSR